MPLQPARLLILFLNDRWAHYLFGIPYDIGQITEVPAFPITNRRYYGNVPQGSIYLTRAHFVIARSEVTWRSRSRNSIPCPNEIAALRSQ